MHREFLWETFCKMGTYKNEKDRGRKTSGK